MTDPKPNPPLAGEARAVDGASVRAADAQTATDAQLKERKENRAAERPDALPVPLAAYPGVADGGDLGPPLWYVPFPLSQYKEDVLALAKARGFKVVDAKLAPKPDDIEEVQKVHRAVGAPVLSIKTELNKTAYPDDAFNARAIDKVQDRVKEDEGRAAADAKRDVSKEKDLVKQELNSPSHQLTGPDRIKIAADKAKAIADEKAKAAAADAAEKKKAAAATSAATSSAAAAHNDPRPGSSA